jgi:capsular polysaccharide biosynthesis protein
MDLISIVQTLWRRKAAAIPVILLTAIAGFYIIAVKPTTYQASASFLLLNPPGPPTAAQIAQHPKLAKVNTGNPYVEYGDLAIVADAVISVVTSSSAGQTLAQEGANPRYQVTVSTDVGNPPILQITGTGTNAEEAIRTANLVASAAENDLYQIQKQENVNPTYMIKPVDLFEPHTAQKSVSSKLRTLIAVLALGAIGLFVVISVIDAVEKRRLANSSDTDVATRSKRFSGDDRQQEMAQADFAASRRSAARR